MPSDAIVVAPAFNIDFSSLISNLSGISCICFFALLFIGLPILSAIQGQRRKLQYIPPRIGIEGHGIKRGLTAVEAGILMDEPLDKVMTMILFGVIKKGAAEVTTRDPLELAFAQTQPANLNQYEIDFLKAFGQKDLGLRRPRLAGYDGGAGQIRFGKNERLQSQRNPGLLQEHHGTSLGASGSGKDTRNQRPSH